MRVIVGKKVPDVRGPAFDAACLGFHQVVYSFS
jgi:hypothetical protein